MSKDQANSPAMLLFTGNPAKLAQSIFQMNLPEDVLRSLPAQTLYMAILHNGMESSAETIQAASLAQVKLILDLDLWQDDTFLEDNFWHWLELEDATEPLRIAQKLLKVFDYKLVALIIGRYVDVITMSDQSDTPPGEGFYTPDLGFTWIKVNLQDQHKYFLLNRLMALLFETDADLFYQVLAAPSVSTGTILEEEAFLDQRRRLAAEGIPDTELASEIHRPMTLREFTIQFKNQEYYTPIVDLDIIPALIAFSDELQPWFSVLQGTNNVEELALEATYITNSAIVFFKIAPSDLKRVALLAAQVRGAINLGFEIAQANQEAPLSEIVAKIGLKPFYQLGLEKLFQARKQSYLLTKASDFETKPIEQQVLIKALGGLFPAIPEAFDSATGQIASHEGRIQQGIKAIEKNSELESALKVLGENQPPTH